MENTNNIETEITEILVEYLKKATGDDASECDVANIPKIARLLYEYA